MNLVAFFSNNELMSAGLLAGEPTKGPLLKAVELLAPQQLLLLVKKPQEQAGSIEKLRSILRADVVLEVLPLEDASNSCMTALVEELRQHEEHLGKYRNAALLNAGSPQERAALWILKHEGFFKGTMIDPPGDYNFIPTPQPLNLKVAEPSRAFDTEANLSASATLPWEAAAIKAGCLGRSPRFRQTMEEAAAIAGHITPILLTGETGCGKEVLAHFIHTMSPRANKALVAVNCAALPETLAESILFGHEKGAFTGAYKRQKGKFEIADGGTLFLDELGELSLANQAKLLRVLETRCIDPLGGADAINVDVRVVAATNRNLQQEVALGRFREDLYYRLRAGEIDIPSLRERASDIPLIALHLLERFNATLAYPKQFSKAALKFLEGQRWPGNVRDLMNTIERAVLLCPRAVVEPEDFKVVAEAIKPQLDNGLPQLFLGFSIEDYLQKIRRELFEKALRQSGGNKSEAARLLGITPQAIHKYLKAEEEKASMQVHRHHGGSE